MKNRHLYFNTAIGVKKPENIRNKEQPCPFCARDELTDILDVEGPMIFLKNKFPVLENAYQTVLIETDQCDGELSTYKKGHLHKLLRFGIKHWFEMENSGLYQSVIFFKNYGPFSGGTIAHPHMQIVGLYDLDYNENLKKDVFDGVTIAKSHGAEFTLSTKPQVGFYELNVKMNDSGYVEEFGKYIQIAAHYILHHFPFKATSYNIFFYHLNGEIYAKVVPRFVTTPIYIGYSLPQVPNNLEWMAEQIRTIYLEQNKKNEM